MITIYLQWISLHTRSLRLDDGDNKSVNISNHLKSSHVSISKLKKIINLIKQQQLKIIVAVSTPVVR